MWTGTVGKLHARPTSNGTARIAWEDLEFYGYNKYNIIINVIFVINLAGEINSLKTLASKVTGFIENSTTIELLDKIVCLLDRSNIKYKRVS